MTSNVYSAQLMQFNINGTDVVRLQNPGSENSSVIFNGSRAITLPVGNDSSDRPTTPTSGMLRYQNTTNNLEFYNGTAWTSVNSGSITLQTSYDSSTSGEIVINNTKTAFKLRDASTPLGIDLFRVQNNTGTVNYFGVNAQGARLANGTETAPSLHFFNDASTGIFRVASNTFGIATDGAERMRITGTGEIRTPNDVGNPGGKVYAWASFI